MLEEVKSNDDLDNQYIAFRTIYTNQIDSVKSKKSSGTLCLKNAMKNGLTTRTLTLKSNKLVRSTK
jgi:hypothetical protein